MLKQFGHTRRAQAITWCPWIDMDIADPPCLQSLSFRVQNYSGAFKLNMIVRFRSNDLYKAYPSNAIALVGIQEIVAKAIGLPVGSYTHISDSMHLYGSYFKEIEGCLNTIKHRRFEDRVWTTKECVPFFIEGCNQLLNETNMPNDKKNLVVARRTYLENNFL
jgi:thymidylate synthase